MSVTDISFQTCSFCHASWLTRDAFLDDVAVEVCGYQADPQAWESGLYLFRHATPGCGNTMSVSVLEFNDLFTGTRYDANRYGTDGCGGHCLELRDLLLCEAECRNAHVREALVLIVRRHWQAQSRANTGIRQP